VSRYRAVVTKLLAVLVVTLVAASTAGAAAAAPARRVLKLGWHESKALPTDGVHAKGELDFTVSRVTVTPSRWTVAATIRNRSDYAIQTVLHDISNPPFPPALCCGTVSWMGIDGYELPKQPGYGRVRVFHLHPATRYSPAIGGVLKPHSTWSGTFSDASPLPRRTDLRVSFGVFRIAGLTWGPPVIGAGFSNEWFNWMTDHSIRL
jgi:hypothetical protein